jgi:MFS family permease
VQVSDEPGAPPRAVPRGLRRFIMDTTPLRHPAYRRLWSSTTVTSVGSQLTAVAVPKQIYDITGSSAWVGISSLIALLPLVAFALWGGAIADTVDRRRLMLVTNIGIALTSLAFFVQAALGMGSVTLLLVLLAAQQGLFGVNSPARSASVARLVPAAELPAANALNSTVMQAGQIIGPLVAGALIPVLGIPVLYLIDTLGLSVTTWAVVKLPPLRPIAVSRAAGLRDVLEGFTYAARYKVLLVSFLADIIAMVFGMPRALFPQMAATTYASAGPGLALGVLYAAIPLGSVAGGLASGTFSRVRRQGRTVVVAICVWGAAVAVSGLSTGSLWIAATFLAVAGAADMVSSVFRNAILNTAVTDEMRGRMQGVFTVVVAGGPRVADLVHGTIGSVIGTRTTVTAGGVLVVALMILVAVTIPVFTRYLGPDETGLASEPLS